MKKRRRSDKVRIFLENQLKGGKVKIRVNELSFNVGNLIDFFWGKFMAPVKRKCEGRFKNHFERVNEAFFI